MIDRDEILYYADCILRSYYLSRLVHLRSHIRSVLFCDSKDEVGKSSAKPFVLRQARKEMQHAAGFEPTCLARPEGGILLRHSHDNMYVPSRMTYNRASFT